MIDLTREGDVFILTMNDGETAGIRRLFGNSMPHSMRSRPLRVQPHW